MKRCTDDCKADNDAGHAIDPWRLENYSLKEPAQK
jgi:hypothetical protein